MHKGRLEAFSDGVIAIIITIMVLEMKVPHDGNLAALKPLVPVFFSYMLSFIYVGTYWNNHHHLMQSVHRVNGRILLANLHLLFWLSLMPFVTAWMGENHFTPWTVAMYGVIQTLSGVAYFILVRSLIHHHGKESILATVIGKDFKGKISVVLYLTAIGSAFVSTRISGAIYVGVAIMWLIPDRRIEKALEQISEKSP